MSRGHGNDRQCDGRPSSTMLPFAQLNATAGRRYFGDGVTRDIVRELGQPVAAVSRLGLLK